MKIEIPLKLPSLNEYVNICRINRYGANDYKKRIQAEIFAYIKDMPKYEKPIKIHFHWIEGNNRRDFDNVCASKKFILDSLVTYGKLKDDNRKCVCAFTDTFAYEKNVWKVILDIEEVE